MCNKQHAAARIGKRTQVVKGAYRQIQIEAGRWFVGHNKARAFDQGARQEHAAGHTARQLKRIHVLNFSAQPVMLEQRALALDATRGIGCIASDAANLSAHLHKGIEVGDALRNERNLTSAQLRERRGILANAVEPDCSRNDGIGFIEAQNAVGQKALARTARADDRHDLARMHRNREVGNHAHIFFASAEKMRFVGVVHGKRHAQIFDLQQMMPMRMVRRRCMRMVMVHRGVAVLMRLMSIQVFAFHIRLLNPFALFVEITSPCSSPRPIPGSYAGRSACASFPQRHQTA